MRILVHDYAGHPFQVQLSRRLAARGHTVLHAYCASTHTPQGELAPRGDDPPGFDARGLSLGKMIPKASFAERFLMERRYGRLLEREALAWRPDVVLSGNTPTLAQYRLSRACARAGVRLAWWVQDIYSVAAQSVLKKKAPLAGSLVGGYFLRLDRECARRSDAIVVISEDFRGVLGAWGVDQDRIHVVHNWAPLDSLPMLPRDNEWARENAPASGVRFLYSGTLAMKHNPRLLLELARTLGERGLGEVVVVSEGQGVEWLRSEAQAQHVDAIRFFGFQPFDKLPEVLASADVLVAVLERDAGVFSVPSKVLTYLCADRPLLLAVPRENLAAKIVTECGAGEVVEPDDLEGFCSAALRLAESESKRHAMARAGRTYAESHFDIDLICDRFEQVLGSAPASHTPSAVAASQARYDS